MQLLNMLSERELSGDQKTFLADAVLAGAHLCTALDEVAQAIEKSQPLADVLAGLEVFYEMSDIYMPARSPALVRAVDGAWVKEHFGAVETAESFYVATIAAGLAEADDEDKDPDADDGEDEDKEPSPAAVQDAEPTDELTETLINEVGYVVGVEPRTIMVEGEARLVEVEPRSPVMVRIRLIKPGWGNRKDNHFYSAEVLERDSPLFGGAPMYLTDHVPEESNTRNWAANITQVDDFVEGAPIAPVIVHQPAFCEHIRNLAACSPSQLDKVAVSIRAMGLTRPYKDEEREGSAVEAFTEVLSVDFVSRAGAGGGVVGMAEVVNADEGEAVLKFDGLTLAELAKQPGGKELVAQLRHELSESLGAGRPNGVGATSTSPPAVPTANEIEERKQAVLTKHGFSKRS